MAAGQMQDEGGHLPSTIANNGSPHTPSQGHTPAGPKRSLTPRGPLFPNLDEAHRNITSRLATNNPFRKTSGESQYTEEIALRDFSIPAFPSDTGNMRSNALPRHATDFVLPHPSRRVTGRSLTPRRDDSGLAPDKDRPGTSDTSKPSEIADCDKLTNTHPPNTSGSTVSRILDHYAAESLVSSLGSSSAAYTFSDMRQNSCAEPCPRDGAATRLGFRGEELDGPSRTQERAQRRESSLPPQPHLDRKDVDENLHIQVTHPSALLNAELQSNNGLSRLPAIVHLDPHRSILRQSSNMRNLYGLSLVAWPNSSSQNSCFGDAQEPSPINNGVDQTLTVGNKVHKVTRSLIPLPLRIPSGRDLRREYTREPRQNRLDALFGDVESSEEENGSTELSDADPFKYDNEEYHRVQQLGKERQVSQAMKHMTEVHTEVSLEHYNKDDGRTDRTLFAIQSGDSDDTSGPPIRRGRPEGSFFDPVAFRALHGDVDYSHEREVKVKIKPSSPPADNFEDKGAGSNTFGLIVERNDLPTVRCPHDLATDGDWVTEATSEMGFDTVNTCAASQGIHHDRGIKITGSSIADFSDDGLESLPKRLNSRNHILQHPSGEPPSDSYEMCNLKDTKQVVFLPKSHIQRVNGFAQNSIRLHPNTPKPADRNDNSQYGGRLSNPFRRKSYKRADAGSYFQYSKDRNAPSKYEFRDSTSEYTPAVDSNQAGPGTNESLASTTMASMNTGELLGRNPDPFAFPATTLERGGFPCGNGDSRNIIQARMHSRRPAELLGGHKQSMFGDDDQPTPMTPTIFKDGSISATSKFKFPLLNLSVAQAIHKRKHESEETDKAENYGEQGERVRSNTSSQSSQTQPLSLPSAVYMRNKSDVRKGSHLSLTFTPPDWRTLEGDQVMPDQDEYTPSSSTCRPLFDHGGLVSQSLATPVTYANAETPTMKKSRWFRPKVQPRKCLLPVDKRIRRAGGSDRIPHSIIQGDLETVQDTEDHCISYKAHTRRRYYFYTMLVLCILPFFALIVLAGHCNAALSYFTNGEVYRLTKRQRRAIKVVFAMECVVYGALVTGIIVYFGLNHRYSS